MGKAVFPPRSPVTVGGEVKPVGGTVAANEGLTLGKSIVAIPPTDEIAAAGKSIVAAGVGRAVSSGETVSLATVISASFLPLLSGEGEPIGDGEFG